MFTGIIQDIGKIVSLENKGGDAQVRIESGKLELSTVKSGDSISVSGVCLTVSASHATEFSADVSGETLARTTLGSLSLGDPVNLETSLTLSTPLGGHLVSGHVDGLGKLVSCRKQGRSLLLRIRAPEGLSRYLAEKGSISVDGVSLTVNSVNGPEFEVNIVPHTLANTTLGNLTAGSIVNLEADILARYLERLIQSKQALSNGSEITREFLARHGFVK
ncbi:MAG: riboflavin synthase [Sulfuricaulis sp.]|uniref:riboflavin synthase n=1 Tax=Sulfuricaulis sp. TaxID=2003553 RepID=UPI0034A1DC8D